MRHPRLAAGRARALNLPTRGTTGPQRLRRVDRWLLATQAGRLRRAADPLVVDLGYGSSPVTTVELAERLTAVRADVHVVGVESARERVDSAQAVARPGLEFVLGGFELGGRRPVIVRAMNVLRQYQEHAASAAWDQLRAGLAEDGLLVEGTADELGRRACWVALDRHQGPISLTLSAHLPSLGAPSDLAERLPKALIHRNVPGEGVHDLLRQLDRGWAAAAPLTTFGPRQRWAAGCAAVRESGWPLLDGPRRWRLGELTIDWSAVRPRASSSTTTGGVGS